MCSIFNIHQFKESCLNGRLVSMACLPSGNRRNPYRNCKNWPSLEHEILRVEKKTNGDRVCVGRRESAGGVGVSAAGCACRPAPSAVPAGGVKHCASRCKLSLQALAMHIGRSPVQIASVRRGLPQRRKRIQS
jgi:hypothetical protein